MTLPLTSRAAAGAEPPRGTLGQRVRVRVLATGAAVLRRLPEGAVNGLAMVGGELAYRFTPARAARGRRNLSRTTAWLAARGLGGARVAAAGSGDRRTLERLVRLAYRHAAHYYLEVARTPLLSDAWVGEHLTIETPEAIEAALAERRAVVLVGLHFGAIELAARYVTLQAGLPITTPMETIPDPELQAWMTRTRGRSGVRIVDLRSARRELLAALRRGEPVGIVGDRDITGGGIPIPLFGATAMLPAGVGLLVLETDAPVFVGAVRRIGGGRYVGRMIPVTVPAADPDLPRRARLTEALTRVGAAMEMIIADAPEQWWAVFFPIWPDLEAQEPTGSHDPEAAA